MAAVAAIGAFGAATALARLRGGLFEDLQILGLLALLIIVAVSYRWTKVRCAAVASIGLIGCSMLAGGQAQLVARSFFGVHRVREFGDVRLLFHGTTVHGIQRVRRPDGSPLDRTRPPIPGAYYHATGALALGLDVARRSASAGRPAFNVGIIGLGVGAMACHGRPGETWTFFEIDPTVVAIARDSGFFDYLPRCQPRAEIVSGDARLTLADRTGAKFDYLLVDAFSSDSVPVHLLTQEALQLYLDRISDEGVVALHVSNRNLDLVSVVAATLDRIPGVASAFIETNPAHPDAYHTLAILVTRHESILAPIRALPMAHRLAGTGVRAWTDDYSDILSALVRKQRARFLGDDERLARYAEAVVRAYPDDVKEHVTLAKLHLKTGNHRAAIASLTSLIALTGPEPNLYRQRGIAHHLAGDDDAAIADLTKVLEHGMPDPTALEFRGAAYGNKGERDKAIADFNRLLELAPDNARIRGLIERLEKKS